MSARADLGLVLRHIRRVMADKNNGPLADRQLLQRFTGKRDADAFASLVRRHGPMVLGVCRSVLRNWHDAEDAFQATFLILARKAGSIHGPKSLAKNFQKIAETCLAVQRVHSVS